MQVACLKRKLSFRLQNGGTCGQVLNSLKVLDFSFPNTGSSSMPDYLILPEAGSFLCYHRVTILIQDSHALEMGYIRVPI